MRTKYIKWFEEVGKSDVSIVGGKGANLGEMLQAGFPVPYGFIVTSAAYFYFVESNKLQTKIQETLKNLDHENAGELSYASKTLRSAFNEGKIPNDLLNGIADHYEILRTRQEEIYKKLSIVDHTTLGFKSLIHSPLVAVRSSATAEDLPTASFAGQQESYLNVQGENHLINKIRECWASLFTERAIYYRHNQKFNDLKVGLAAVVQLMVQSEKSGIAFSIDPVTNDKSLITIEAILGLGEYIVQGKITPDHFEVDKKNLAIKKVQIRHQDVALVKKGNQNIEIRISKKAGNSVKISDAEVIQIAKLVKNIEKHYFFPQDIEWAIENKHVYIVQSRPITTTGKAMFKAETDISLDKYHLIKADPASPGVGYGRPVILSSPAENDLIKKGDILVARYTSPDYVPAMKRASAIITEMGGRTSHAAIVSRELGIPAVVGALKATALLKHESIVTVNGSTGLVYRGNVYKTASQFMKKITPSNHHLKTLTKVYVNLAQPEAAQRISKFNVDGIGLLRAEFIMADIGVHPKLVIKQHKQNDFIDKLVDKLLMFVKPFSPRPIVYRATDFRTNEYRHLKGGELYEPHE